MKDEFYFPHFINARNDRKLRRVRKELGAEGYGIYFMILEILRTQTDYKYPMADIDLLSDEIGTQEPKVRVVICNYSLFTVDEQEKFFSPKLIEFIEPYLKNKEIKRILGLKGNLKRWHPKIYKQVESGSLSLSDGLAMAEQSLIVAKEKKGKERKEKEIDMYPFETFYELYPRKVGKEVARRAYNKLTEEEKVMAVVAAPKVSAEEKRFIPYPATWINGKRWEDEGIEAQTQEAKIAKLKALPSHLRSKAEDDLIEEYESRK